jgi:hypothetical protein
VDPCEHISSAASWQRAYGSLLSLLSKVAALKVVELTKASYVKHATKTVGRPLEAPVLMGLDKVPSSVVDKRASCFSGCCGGVHVCVTW